MPSIDVTAIVFSTLYTSNSPRATASHNQPRQATTILATFHSQLSPPSSSPKPIPPPHFANGLEPDSSSNLSLSRLPPIVPLPRRPLTPSQSAIRLRHPRRVPVEAG
eukprot:scaffold39505_cov33-Tisochrysis_lutea.AAC.1